MPMLLLCVVEERVFEERVFEGRVFEERVFGEKVFEERVLDATNEEEADVMRFKLDEAEMLPIVC